MTLRKDDEKVITMSRGKTNESNKTKKPGNPQPNSKGNKQNKEKPDATAGKSQKEAGRTRGKGQTRAGKEDKREQKLLESVAVRAKNKRIAKWEKEENLVLLEGWARDGLSMEQIAHNMGIAKDTLYRWLKISSYISDAIKKGKEVTDYLVENALFNSALQGNVVAQIFWLKNRKPDRWKDKVEQVIDTEADTAGIVLLAPVLEKNHEPTEESDLGATAQAN